MTPEVSVQTLKEINLPDNYVAVMAAAITFADKREKDIPGVFSI